MSNRLEDYNYHLPSELIAQYPAEPRDSSRLLVLDRKSGDIKEGIFSDIMNYINEGDLLVLNDAKVIPARIYARKETGGRIELLLLEEIEKNIWHVLLRPGRGVKPGLKINIASNLRAIVLSKEETGSYKIRFESDGKKVIDLLDEIGEIPLPPYIKRPATDYDKERYQTVYAATPGAIASPTAGLHLTEELLGKLKGKGIRIAYLTLLVGWGTFRQVSADDVREHEMASEYISVPAETIRAIKEAKQRANRIIAVGTTVVRAVESLSDKELAEGKKVTRYTGLYIYPPYRFKLTDALITNFHLPRTTLIVLVSAFAGREKILKAYSYAIKNKFRFYSYGDAMLII